jgi:hypothetical protein
MWIPIEFRTGQKTVHDGTGHTRHLTGLVVDGVTMSNSIQHVDWDWDPRQLFVCETCFEPGCASGHWASIRRAGDHVVFLPAFSRDPTDKGDHEPIPLILSKGAMLLATDWAADDQAVAALERLLAAGLASDVPVALEPLSGARRAVTFYLDQARGFVEWQPLAMGAEPPRLLLAPGYVMYNVT